MQEFLYQKSKSNRLALFNFPHTEGGYRLDKTTQNRRRCGAGPNHHHGGSMKMIITGVCLFLLSGCGVLPQKSAIPEQELLVDKEIHSMSRLEVVNAIQDCQVARTRAVVIYGKRKVGGVTRDVVVDVSCAPLY